MTIIWIILLLAYLLWVAVAFRILLKPFRDPLSRTSWMFMIFAFSYIGVISYILFWETELKKKYIKRSKKIKAKLSKKNKVKESNKKLIPQKYKNTFTLASSINDNKPVAGNSVTLKKNSVESIENMIKDINNAKKTIHISFYIWLDDKVWLRMLKSVINASKRWVKCRIMVDGMWSKKLIAHDLWKSLVETEVEHNIIFPLNNIIKILIHSRVDIRNHRKIFIIDNDITYCWSQNCCSEDFYVKPKYAPWVDNMLRVEWWLVHQNQKIFVTDWFVVTNDDISEILQEENTNSSWSSIWVAFWTWPTERHNSASRLLESTFHNAKETLFIVTPYYVPSQALQSSLCALAEWWVHVRIIFPKNNDSFVVWAASRSYYRELLTSWVEIYEYKKWLLHSKITVIDNEVSLIGSTNLDRRSFDLNYENSMLIFDEKLAKDINKRQDKYISDSTKVNLEDVLLWSRTRNIKNNILAIIGPLL